MRFSISATDVAPAARGSSVDDTAASAGLLPRTSARMSPSSISIVVSDDLDFATSIGFSISQSASQRTLSYRGKGDVNHPILDRPIVAVSGFTNDPTGMGTAENPHRRRAIRGVGVSRPCGTDGRSKAAQSHNGYLSRDV